MRRMERVAGAAAVLAAAVCLLAATPAGAQALPDGRALQPDGTLVGVGNFPTGGALTPDGRFYWTVSSGFGANYVQIVSVAGARVVSTVRLPGASGGIVMDPVRPVAYVSGIADSNQPELQAPEAQGRGGDVIHIISYDPTSGAATPSRNPFVCGSPQMKTTTLRIIQGCQALNISDLEFRIPSFRFRVFHCGAPGSYPQEMPMPIEMQCYEKKLVRRDDPQTSPKSESRNSKPLAHSLAIPDLEFKISDFPPNRYLAIRSVLEFVGATLLLTRVHTPPALWLRNIASTMQQTRYPPAKSHTVGRFSEG